MKKKENKTKNMDKKSKRGKGSLNNIDMIKETAYYIWLKNGCHENNDLENWYQAGRELNIK